MHAQTAFRKDANVGCMCTLYTTQHHHPPTMRPLAFSFAQRHHGSLRSLFESKARVRCYAGKIHSPPLCLNITHSLSLTLSLNSNHEYHIKAGAFSLSICRPSCSCSVSVSVLCLCICMLCRVFALFVGTAAALSSRVCFCAYFAYMVTK